MQLETARQLCARAQTYHCSRLGQARRPPKQAQGPAAGCRDRKFRTRHRRGTEALREHRQGVRRQDEAGQWTSQRASRWQGLFPGLRKSGSTGVEAARVVAWDRRGSGAGRSGCVSAWESRTRTTLAGFSGLCARVASRFTLLAVENQRASALQEHTSATGGDRDPLPGTTKPPAAGRLTDQPHRAVRVSRRARSRQPLHLSLRSLSQWTDAQARAETHATKGET